jgi:hypothetical protein
MGIFFSLNRYTPDIHTINVATILQVNTAYFYGLLFTRENLKLVHIVCHDKQEHHAAKCDKKKYFVKNS